MINRKPANLSSQEANALLEVVTAQGAALVAHGERLKKIEDWIRYLVRNTRPDEYQQAWADGETQENQKEETAE